MRHWRDAEFWQDIIIRNLLLPVLFPTNRGQSVNSSRWDNLVILDACRYDSFERQAHRLGGIGKLESRVSMATDTRTFLLNNFQDRLYDDIVYVTANPQVSRFMKGKFHAIIPVWLAGWDEKESTVLPSTVSSYALDAARRYPGKRLIVHYIQPHHPYLGFRPPFAKMRRIEKRPPDIYSPWPKSHSWYTYFITHEVQGLLRLYENNLVQALNSVVKLISGLNGITVITADHGEAFGERLHPLIPIKVFEHPPDVRISSLVKVPWYTVEARNERPETDAPISSPEVHRAEDDEIIKDRLKALGYE